MICDNFTGQPTGERVQPMNTRNAEASHLTTKKAQHVTPTAKFEAETQSPSRRGRRRPDPLAGFWDHEIVPMLKGAPALRPISVYRELRARHPQIRPGVRRTLERRIRAWQTLNDPSPDVVFLQLPSPDRRLPPPQVAFSLLRAAHQGILQLPDLPAHARAHKSISDILNRCKSGTLAKRNKALLALAVVCGLPLGYLAEYPVASERSLYRWKGLFIASGFLALMETVPREKLRFKDASVANAIFNILHEPPGLHGFHRTNWRQVDLHAALKNTGTNVSIWTIRRVVRANKYQWRKAKVVLTSNDPEYRTKVDNIKRILSTLRDDERFFSIDEYGPFTVRLMTGRKLCAPDQFPFVPQWQKGRGTIILTGALELRTNQITRFYSEKKNTNEMIKLVELLRRQYGAMKTVYISWDAAGWHASKALDARVEFMNGWAMHDQAPTIELAPLPSRAQFLNVIESVFSGMSRAVIQNSNFEDASKAKEAIDRYLADRNRFYGSHPKRAGRKIWKLERCQAAFQEENNCKDPRCR